MKIEKMVRNFLAKYPRTLAFRKNQHLKVAKEAVDDDEKVLYAFIAQKNRKDYIPITAICMLTDKRIIIVSKNLFFGSKATIIGLDLFNDIHYKSGLIFGRIVIDTVKEEVVFRFLDKNSLSEIAEIIFEITQRYKKERRNKR